MIKQIEIFLLISFTFILFGCGSLNSHNNLITKVSYIEDCQKNWSYNILNDTIELKILLVDHKKSINSSIAIPNFFIGINDNNDTIGIIDEFASIDCKKGQILNFEPHDYEVRNPFKYDIITVHKKKYENNLYCRVKFIYFGKFIEINNKK